MYPVLTWTSRNWESASFCFQLKMKNGKVIKFEIKKSKSNNHIPLEFSNALASSNTSKTNNVFISEIFIIFFYTNTNTIIKLLRELVVHHEHVLPAKATCINSLGTKACRFKKETVDYIGTVTIE